MMCGTRCVLDIVGAHHVQTENGTRARSRRAQTTAVRRLLRGSVHYWRFIFVEVLRGKLNNERLSVANDCTPIDENVFNFDFHDDGGERGRKRGRYTLVYLLRVQIKQYDPSDGFSRPSCLRRTILLSITIKRRLITTIIIYTVQSGTAVYITNYDAHNYRNIKSVSIISLLHYCPLADSLDRRNTLFPGFGVSTVIISNRL